MDLMFAVAHVQGHPVVSVWPKNHNVPPAVTAIVFTKRARSETIHHYRQLNIGSINHATIEPGYLPKTGVLSTGFACVGVEKDLVSQPISSRYCLATNRIQSSGAVRQPQLQKSLQRNPDGFFLLEDRIRTF